MNKYKVIIPFSCFVHVEVEAAGEDEAIDQAFGDVYLTSYCGNGGCDKLIGVDGDNVSIEPGEHINCECFEVEVYEE